VAHRDLSLEHVVLDRSAGGGPQVKLVNFAKASLSRKCRDGSRGKAAYQAPEMHLSREYDAFLADAFALGVMLFAMVSGELPWLATRPGVCRTFSFVSAVGIMPLLERKVPRALGGRSLAEAFSPSLLALLHGMLAVQPFLRLTLGERCWQGARPSVTSMRWLLPREEV